jgi:hypothetical protein
MFHDCCVNIPEEASSLRFIGYSVKNKLFATMLTGPKINADVLTPPHGFLLTCRGEKYT